MRKLADRYYSDLNYEDNTPGNANEYDKVAGKIGQRGYVSEGSACTGYALADLDGDGNPELLLCDNSANDSLYKQTPAISSVYAIRGGQLACIENDSLELREDTCLTTDGAFYQSVGYPETGYASLSKFRLETGASTFTIESSACASLSFAHGDVPVPYWTKTEQGKDIPITEDEFDALYKQYNNPGKLMALNFIPVYPGAANSDSTSYSSETSPTLQITYPRAYRNAPSEYKSILDDLYYLSESIRKKGSSDDGSDFGRTGFCEYPYPLNEELGYAIIDINHDGILELLLGTKSGLKDSLLNSIFTLKDGKPVLLSSFWSRSNGMISTDGIIYSVGSGGAAYTYLSSFKLDRNADNLTQLTDIRSDYSSSAQKAYYIQTINDRNTYIPERTFMALLKKYENPSKPMRLTFIPIETR